MGLAMFRGHLSMISEWMENRSLMAYINQNTGIDRIQICIGIFSGLSHIHANDMVHGDLKAANVMVSRDGIAMIADFGNSQLKDLTLKFTNTTSSSLSVRWAVRNRVNLLGLANEFHQAPELLDGDDDPQVSKESDVYAYGMTVLETLTGKVPFEEFGERKVLTLVALKRQMPTRPAVGVSDEIWEILRRCWAWKQTERPNITSVEKLIGDAYTQTRIKAKEPDYTGGNHLEMNETTVPESEISTSTPDDPPGNHRGQPQGVPAQEGVHLGQAQLGKSESPATGALAVQKAAPQDSLDTLQNMYFLGVAHFEQGRLAEAESLWATVVAAWREVLGADHPNTLQGVHCLVATYLKQGRLTESESLGLEVVAARKRVLGVDHPDTLQSTNCLAVIYQEQGRLAEAGVLGVEVVAARKRVLGAEHPDTLWSLHNLAFARYRQGQLSEAASLGLEVGTARKRVLGAEHPETLWSLHNLALTYQEQGRLVEAVSLGVEVVAARRRVLGNDHIETLQSMHNLALAHEKQGQHAEAESLGVEVVASRKRVLGADHIDTLWSMQNLAILYRKQGYLAKAESLGVGVLAARKRILGEAHPDTINSMLTVAGIYQAQYRNLEAQALLSQVENLRK